MFREQVDINLAFTVDSKTMMPMVKWFSREKTHVISLLMYYDNRKNKILKMLSSVVYFIMENYVLADYLCCQQTKIYVLNKVFENTTYNDI